MVELRAIKKCYIRSYFYFIVPYIQHDNLKALSNIQLAKQATFLYTDIYFLSDFISLKTLLITGNVVYFHSLWKTMNLPKLTATERKQFSMGKKSRQIFWTLLGKRTMQPFVTTTFVVGKVFSSCSQSQNMNRLLQLPNSGVFEIASSFQEAFCLPFMCLRLRMNFGAEHSHRWLSLEFRRI